MFYIGEITTETKDLFVNRESDIEYVLRTLKRATHTAISVRGEIGTGKTSFLNVLSYYLNNEGISVRKVTAEDILSGKVSKRGEYVERDGYTRSGERVKVYLVDDVEKLDDKRAMEVYRKLMDIRENVSVVFTSRISWSEEVEETIKLLSRGMPVDMRITPEMMIYFLDERFKRLGIENRFEREALLLAGERANQNLRDFFRYAGRAYEFKEKGKITVETMKDAILAEDLSYYASMREMERIILRTLITHGEMTNQELMKSVKEIMGYRDKKYYKARDFLEQGGYIRVNRAGKKIVIKDIYHILQIEVTEDMLDNPQFYARKLRDEYIFPKA